MSAVSPDIPVQPRVAVSSGLGRDAVLVSVCTLISRITGFVRVVATAAVLGTGVLADVYQTANMIPNLLFELVAGGVLQAVLVPSFVAARREHGDSGLTEATRAMCGVVVGGLTLLTIAGMVLAPVISHLMVLSEPNTALAHDKIGLMVPMVLTFVPQLLCYGFATVTQAALNARGRYVAAALAPAVNNIVVVAACIAFRATRTGDGVVGLHLTTWQFLLIAGGTTLGVVAFSLTPAFALNAVGVSWWPSWNPHHPAVRNLRGSFGWMTLSIVSTLVPTTAALALGNGAAGGVAVFMYAFAFFVLPHALIAVTLATTLGPRVAEGWQGGRVREVRSAIDGAMKAAVPLLTLAAAGMVALAWPLTRLVANFGQTASQGEAPIAHTLAAFGPGLIGYGIAFVMLRVLFVLGEVRDASLLMVISAIVGVVVMAVLSRSMAESDRAAALAIGYGSSQVVGAVLLSIRVHRLTRAMSLSRSAGLLVEAAIAGSVGCGAMWIVEHLLDPLQPPPLLGFLAGGTAGVLAFTGVMVMARGRDLWSWLPRPG
jgi:putative peptidoglycan lipid II flippase